MFQQQMKKYTLESPQVSKNEWNEPITDFAFDRNIEIAICMNSRNAYNANDTSVLNLELVGITKDKDIKKGDRVGGKYIVGFVEVNRLFSIVYLKEIGNDGRF